MALAALSTRFVENPLAILHDHSRHATTSRGVRRGRRDPALLVSAAGQPITFDRSSTTSGRSPRSNPDYPGALAIENGFRYAGNRMSRSIRECSRCSTICPPFTRTVLSAGRRLGAATLRYGDPSSTRTLALVGGSHSVHWLPALEVIAKKQGWRIVVLHEEQLPFQRRVGDIEQDEWCGNGMNARWQSCWRIRHGWSSQRPPGVRCGRRV